MKFCDKLSQKDLENLTSKVKDLGLEKPVDFLVESHYPLANLFKHLLLLVEPIMSPFLSLSRVKDFSTAMEDDDTRQAFLNQLRAK